MPFILWLSVGCSVSVSSSEQQQQNALAMLWTAELTTKRLATRPLFLVSHPVPCLTAVPQVPGVLTPHEAQQFIDAAEGLGFEHQGSRGAAYGEAYR
jgi:hypothetical protein